MNTNTHPIISIIVPCYNQAQYMRETLDSIKEQELQNWECVIVNDGSSDNTLEIAKEYSDMDCRFIVVNKENGGLADARNAGIKASHGIYILPLDSDDKIDKTYTKKAVEYFETHPKTKVVYCKALLFGDKNEEWKLREFQYEALLWENRLFCSSVYKRADYDLTSGYNKNMKYGLEDWDFWISLIGPTDDVHRIPEHLFYYRKHGESMLTTTNKKTTEAFTQIVLNHLDLYKPYLHNLIRTNSELIYYKSELQGIINSNAYRIGKFILYPLTCLKNIFAK